MASFELGLSEWYKPVIVDENQFLNARLTTDQYGKWYSVVFEGSASTYLMMAVDAPEVNKSEYGHLETAKSGKSIRFKRDKQPEEGEKPKEVVMAESHKSDDIMASMAVKISFEKWCDRHSLIPEAGLPMEESDWKEIEFMADMIYRTVKKTGKPSEEMVKRVFTGEPE